MTREKAIELGQSGWWVDKPDYDVALFQLQEEMLCMPFGDFHKAVEGALKRPVWTHEFAKPDLLLKELLGDREKPTMEEIIGQLPEAKTILAII